nr:sigma-70 family RNA polymerase sigma factor [Psychromicrobium silvestre]
MLVVVTPGGAVGLSDEELLVRARDGEVEAFEKLFIRHRQQGYWIARRYCGNSSDADDVLSDAFTYVLARIQAGEGPREAFRPYLLTAVSRIAQRYNLVNNRTTPTDDLSVIDTETIDDNRVIRQAETELVAKSFTDLPPRWRSVLWLSEVDGLKPREVAPFLGIKANAVSVLLNRAKRGLRENFIDNYVARQNFPECENFKNQAKLLVQAGMSAKDNEELRAHAAECHWCNGLLGYLDDTKIGMRGVVFPAVTGLAFLLPSEDHSTRVAAIVGRRSWQVLAIAAGSVLLLCIGLIIWQLTLPEPNVSAAPPDDPNGVALQSASPTASGAQSPMGSTSASPSSSSSGTSTASPTSSVFAPSKLLPYTGVTVSGTGVGSTRRVLLGFQLTAGTVPGTTTMTITVKGPYQLSGGVPAAPGWKCVGTGAVGQWKCQSTSSASEGRIGFVLVQGSGQGDGSIEYLMQSASAGQIQGIVPLTDR